MTTRFERMYRARLDAGQYVCVGLDPDAEQLPDVFSPGSRLADNVLGYVKAIVDATHHKAAAYKPQSAYYEALGPRGADVLLGVCEHIRRVDSSIPIILDYKRGDIGRTSEQYVQAAFKRLDVDAVTVSPYLGMEAMKPFLDQDDRHVFVLCRTSNKGAGEFQNLLCYPYVDMDTGLYYSTMEEAKREGAKGELEVTAMHRMYEFVALRVARSWNRNGNCGVVVGATAPEELGVVRRLVGGDMIILVPGIGTQGGDLAASIRLGRGDDWLAEVFNNSSAIMFAYKKGTRPNGGPYRPVDWEIAAAYAVESMNHEVAMLV